MSIAIDIQGLHYKYGEETVLNDISFTIKPGSFVSIIGPNGSGKSTLLKNISSILKPYSGVVKLGQQNAIDMTSREIARKIGVVPQETDIAFRFTVQDIVMMGRNPHLGRFESEHLRDYQIAMKAMEQTDTWKLKDRFINEISGGERQRVIIAKALAQEPKIILLDEPTAYLDIQHQVEILELLEKLRKTDGLTVVAVLHDMNLAARFSSYMLLLKRGKIMAKGRPEEVITQEYLQTAFEIDVLIGKSPYTGTPFVIPLSKNKKERKERQEKIHVICGGGTGVEVIQGLWNQGFQLSAGVLNIGDSDWEMGKICGIRMVEEVPFTEISEEKYKENLSVIEESDIIILTSIPIGLGNLKNLDAAVYAVEQNKNVLFLDYYDRYDQFDYTKGLGTKTLSQLINKGMITCKDMQDILHTINQVV